MDVSSSSSDKNGVYRLKYVHFHQISVAEYVAIFVPCRVTRRHRFRVEFHRVHRENDDRHADRDRHEQTGTSVKIKTNNFTRRNYNRTKNRVNHWLTWVQCIVFRERLTIVWTTNRITCSAPYLRSISSSSGEAVVLLFFFFLFWWEGDAVERLPGACIRKYLGKL